jgi:hypothetical protein
MLQKKDHLVDILFQMVGLERPDRRQGPRSRASYFYLPLFVQKIHARPLEEEKQEDHAANI